jgi:hypothetical protein
MVMALPSPLRTKDEQQQQARTTDSASLRMNLFSYIKPALPRLLKVCAKLSCRAKEVKHI